MSVLVERNDGVVVVMIDRPDVHNCVDSPTADALEEAVRAFDANDDDRVLVLTGAGGKAFCSGADLKNPPRLRDAGPMGMSRLEVGKPVIAAIEGYCFAGGLELAQTVLDGRLAVTHGQRDMHVCVQEFAEGSM